MKTTGAIFRLKRLSAEYKEKRLSVNHTGDSAPASLERREKSYQDKIQSIKDVIDNYMRASQTELNLHVHEETGQLIAEVISREDGRVVQTLPPKEILDMYATIKREVGGKINRKI
jgi:flagellar protein FlaG